MAEMLFDLNQRTTASVDYDFKRCWGSSEVPMLRVVKSFDGPELLTLVAASILVITIAFLF